MAVPRASSNAERPKMLDILPDVYYTLDHGRPTRVCDAALKKNLNASKPSEYPPSGRKLSKDLGGNIDRRDKNFSRYLNGFPDGSSIGSTVYYQREAHRCTVVYVYGHHI